MGERGMMYSGEGQAERGREGEEEWLLLSFGILSLKREGADMGGKWWWWEEEGKDEKEEEEEGEEAERDGEGVLKINSLSFPSSSLLGGRTF